MSFVKKKIYRVVTLVACVLVIEIYWIECSALSKSEKSSLPAPRFSLNPRQILNLPTLKENVSKPAATSKSDVGLITRKPIKTKTINQNGTLRPVYVSKIMSSHSYHDESTGSNNHMKANLSEDYNENNIVFSCIFHPYERINSTDVVYSKFNYTRSSDYNYFSGSDLTTGSEFLENLMTKSVNGCLHTLRTLRNISETNYQHPNITQNFSSSLCFECVDSKTIVCNGNGITQVPDIAHDITNETVRFVIFKNTTINDFGRDDFAKLPQTDVLAIVDSLLTHFNVEDIGSRVTKELILAQNKLTSWDFALFTPNETCTMKVINLKGNLIDLSVSMFNVFKLKLKIICQ